MWRWIQLDTIQTTIIIIIIINSIIIIIYVNLQIIFYGEHYQSFR